MSKSRSAEALRQTMRRPFHVARDLIGRAHFKPAEGLSDRAARFRELQLRFIKGDFNHLQAELKLCLCIILFDVVITSDDLLLAINNSHLAYSWRGRRCIAWQDDTGRTNRRILSPFSRRILKGFIGLPLIGTSVLEELDAELAVSCQDIGNLETLLGDSQAWAYEVLPGPFMAHCTNLIPLACVPEGCLARETSGLALAKVTKDSVETDSAMDAVLNAYFSPRQRDGGPWLVEQIKAACSAKFWKSAASARQDMLTQCMALAPHCEEAGPLTSLLLAWVMDFIAHGTPWNGVYQPSTIQGYISVILAKLYEILKNTDLEALDASEFDARYTRILNSVTPSSQGTAHAAIAAWHYFLCCWFDVPVLSRSFSNEIADETPRANVVWNHELTMIDEWLASATLDERLAMQVRLALLIARDIRIRARELLRLRMRNVIIEGDRVAIEIARLRRDPRLKSESGSRVQEITNHATVRLLISWFKRRKLEGALGDDLLFGDPHSPEQGYQLGAMHRLINQLLKTVTGDISASFHTMSHTWVCNKFLDALMAQVSSEINALDQLSAFAGHASSHISLVNYFHFVETLIRHFADVALKSLPLTGHLVALHSDISAATFRKRCSRRSEDAAKSTVAWTAIDSADHISDLPDISKRFQLSAAQAPTALYKNIAAGFKKILDVLSDLSLGKTLSETCSRCNLSERLVIDIVSIGCDVLTELNLLQRSPRKLHESVVITNYQSAFNDRCAIDFRRCDAAKTTPLARFLASSSIPPTYRRGLDSWRACFNCGYVALTTPGNALGLIEMLHSAGIASDKLIVRIATFSKGLDTARQLQAEVGAIFASVYGLPPVIDETSHRRGRPLAHVVISSNKLSVGCLPNSAAVSMAGFNALMLTALVHLRFDETKNVERSAKTLSESLETCHARAN